MATPPKHVDQPKSFEFTPENQEKIKEIISRYPEGRQQSAVMPLLDLAQRQHDNWIPTAAMVKIAEILDMPEIRVFEVATFYTMYNLAPVGKYLLQFCTTTPCMLCGSDDILDGVKKKLGVGVEETTEDGLFTIKEVECLGACVNAPMVQINDDYYEDLTPELMEQLLDKLAKGDEVKVGSQQGRTGSMAASGPTTLKDLAPAE
ncbi:MAG TPA: NADH-quinone oxidoreductase subunit NuoE [Rhodospirillaceae bacterium]|nr:NADH-quinone oxidoreductase subunit NuoE [Alphaproteobacteria bacterium]OUT42277.1 MAG: NADH-quinone oxidoreductase subunit E [Micavibrio sp. TMED2]HCI47532.1 NADH-quinone oxidoreductase subunit NuoE [Rhodospirillaceae bacterium]MAS46090.1 NADH-quinone oxidoreductase subunit NuoE [Alphaproteobacteria bacterium]MAX95727.1 NADH-quinone oxidoreductase subunit NuoE [Alphaproteobacteria bacterium]